MLDWRRTTVFVVLASSLGQSQLVIDNPDHLDVPEEQAHVLFLTTTRVMEKEFHVPGVLENKFRMKLVLGQKGERFTIDDPAGNGTLYLERWNEFKFTATTMRLAIQQLLVPQRQERMLTEILRRAHEIAPVSAARLRTEPLPPRPNELRDDCIGEITNAAVPGRPCRPGRMPGRTPPMSPN